MAMNIKDPGRSAAPIKRDKLYEILERVDALPRLDSRTDDEILGCENGFQINGDR